MGPFVTEAVKLAGEGLIVLANYCPTVKYLHTPYVNNSVLQDLQPTHRVGWFSDVTCLTWPLLYSVHLVLAHALSVPVHILTMM